VFHHAATDIIVELSDHSNTGVLKVRCRYAVVVAKPHSLRCHLPNRFFYEKCNVFDASTRRLVQVRDACGLH
jgi:hypothetical protein